ncbi:Pao retrotransposon peptidase superfamily, partial [Trichinella spiralis]|uniref:Pao retrotransposon peptidase superfamily n=1 Tax=Trichinella spiralis TaxID=6334 RepID=UPI0001EFEB54
GIVAGEPHHLLTPSAPKKQTPRPEGLDDTNTPPGKKARAESNEETTTRVLLANTRGSTKIRFQTVKAIATGVNGQRLTVNCLFDSGAETTLVTEEVARALNLVGTSETVTVKGIGGIQCAPTVARRVRFRLSPVDTNQSGVGDKTIEALTLPRICDDIHSVPIQCDEWKHLQHLQLPEEEDEKLPIHVLIGVDSYGQFLGEKILRGNPTDPVAIETTLGWVVFGPVNPPSAHQYRFHCAQKEDNMECTLKKFWELESIGIQQQEDKTTQDAVSRQFLDTLTHNGSRYSVGLLWKPGVVQLPDNYALAERRLRSVERRLRKDPTKQREYSAVIEEYLRNGWAEEVTTQIGQPGKTWYLPHHAVYKMADGQTKCRVVFDGSAKCAGVSLNDHLETGPNLQADLVSILLRFRQYRIAVQADIEKMYLQVGLRAEDRDACRFLWRDCRSDAPPRRYRLTRVCFGLACSPYLAIKVIKMHAELNPEESNETVKKALANMYVDDLVMSCDKEDERLWTLGLGWDTLLPPDIERQWRSWQEQLKTLAWIPYPVQQVRRVELHIFGDASQVAYAACAYIMVESINHHKLVSLVMAKSRVAPIKQISLPRLELMAALLCARIKKYLERELTLSIQEITCWSDSRVALAWIKGAPARWKPFVANRVQEIQESVSPKCWRYCPTKENPADIPSRGCSLGTLINTATWWHGPPWLMQGRENWPNAAQWRE